MKEVNLKFAITDLEGQAIEDAPNASKIIGNALLQGQHDDSLKVMDWALSLGKHGKLALDNSDYEKFKKIITEMKLPVITKAPVLKAINEARAIKHGETLQDEPLKAK